MMDRDLFGEVVAPPASSMLASRFGVPPFSVLSARDGDWQERKRQWLALGIKSELGRGESLMETAACAEYLGGGLMDTVTPNARGGASSGLLGMRGAIERREAIGRSARLQPASHRAGAKPLPEQEP